MIETLILKICHHMSLVKSNYKYLNTIQIMLCQCAQKPLFLELMRLVVLKCHLSSSHKTDTILCSKNTGIYVFGIGSVVMFTRF